MGTDSNPIILSDDEWGCGCASQSPERHCIVCANHRPKTPCVDADVEMSPTKKEVIDITGSGNDTNDPWGDCDDSDLLCVS